MLPLIKPERSHIVPRIGRAHAYSLLAYTQRLIYDTANESRSSMGVYILAARFNANKAAKLDFVLASMLKISSEMMRAGAPYNSALAAFSALWKAYMDWNKWMIRTEGLDPSTP